MKKILLASMALAALIVSPALAADLPRKAPPPPMPAPVPFYTWTGCYIGANAGWVRAETSVSFSGVEDFSRSTNGGAFGGQIGCDYQFATNWVIGIQGLLDGTNIGADRAGVRFPNTSFHADLDGFATVTARLGYAFTPSFLLYGKVGWGGYKASLTATNILTGLELGSVSRTQSGLDAGVGAEWLFAPNWSLWVEWDHIWAGDKTVFFPNLAGGTTANVERDLDKVLIGINWRFSGLGGPGR